MQGGWKSRLRGNVSGSEGRDLLCGLLYRVENNTNGRRICPTIARNRHLLFFDESPLEISRNRQPVVPHWKFDPRIFQYRYVFRCGLIYRAVSWQVGHQQCMAKRARSYKLLHCYCCANTTAVVLIVTISKPSGGSFSLTAQEFVMVMIACQPERHLHVYSRDPGALHCSLSCPLCTYVEENHLTPMQEERDWCQKG